MAAAADPHDVLRSTDGKENFIRLARLLISGGTTLLRETFDMIISPSTLPTILNNSGTKAQLKTAKLTKPQWDCLYPSPGLYGRSTDFDVTLLFRLLRTICNLAPPTTGWDAIPATSDHSLTADLVRIKYYRNSVYGHVNHGMSITDDAFLRLWKEISEALVRIAGQISPKTKTEWQVAVDKFLKDPLTVQHERHVGELEMWYKSDTDVKKCIEELKIAVAEEGRDIKGIKDHLERDGTQEGINRLETMVQDLKTRLEKVNKSIDRLNSSAGLCSPSRARLRLWLDCERLAGPSSPCGVFQEAVIQGSTGITLVSDQPQFGAARGTQEEALDTQEPEGVVQGMAVARTPVIPNMPQAVVTRDVREDLPSVVRELPGVVQGAPFVDPRPSSQPQVGTTSESREENVGDEALRSTQEVLNMIASKYLQKLDPSTPEDFNGFIQYMQKVREAIIVDVTTGSLIITVECSSLQILDKLWIDYTTGRLDEMAQKFLVTEDVLKAFGLTELKLKTTIVEEEYRACREVFLTSLGAGRAANLISRGGQAIMRTGVGGVLAAGAIPAFTEGLSVNHDVNNLQNDLHGKKISRKQYDKTVKKRCMIDASNVMGVIIGTLAGEVLIPIPFVGAAVGGAVGGVGGRFLGNIGASLAFGEDDGDGANCAKNSKEDSEEDLGGADNVEESDEDNEDVPVVGHCGRAHYADNDDVEGEEDNFEVIAFPESDGGADYGEESDEDSEEGLGGGGYCSHFSGADYAGSNYVEDDEEDFSVAAYH